MTFDPEQMVADDNQILRHANDCINFCLGWVLLWLAHVLANVGVALLNAVCYLYPNPYTGRWWCYINAAAFSFCLWNAIKPVKFLRFWLREYWVSRWIRWHMIKCFTAKYKKMLRYHRAMAKRLMYRNTTNAGKT